MPYKSDYNISAFKSKLYLVGRIFNEKATGKIISDISYNNAAIYFGIAN